MKEYDRSLHSPTTQNNGDQPSKYNEMNATDLGSKVVSVAVLNSASVNTKGRGPELPNVVPIKNCLDSDSCSGSEPYMNRDMTLPIT